MKRLLTALVILLVVLVAGISALVLLVNPNDFRAYLVKKVEEKSGYQLALAGELRWHVWPQLSILSGQMSLTAPGAAEPVIHADNLRLDVKFWPLLSHQLEVKQVLLKGAVIRLTPESEAQQPKGAPQAPPQTGRPALLGQAWSLGIGSVQMADSLLIWQREDNHPINMRDINLSLEQNAAHLAHLSLSGRVNRDQRDLELSLAAALDLSQYPRQIAADITRLTYQLQGVELPAGGIEGQGTGQVSYQVTPPQLQLSQFSLTANHNQFSGSAMAQWGETPQYQLNLNADTLDLGTLLGLTEGGNRAVAVESKAASAPVVAEDVDSTALLQLLNGMTAQLAIRVNTLLYRDLKISDLVLQAEQQRGILHLPTLSGRLGDGTFSLSGSTFTVSEGQPRATLLLRLERIELSPLWSALGMQQTLAGAISLQGELSGDRFHLAAWHGRLKMQMESARLYGFNIQQLIQQTVERTLGQVRGQDQYVRYTEVSPLHANVFLNQGKVNITELYGESALLSLAGSGVVDLLQRSCDMNLKVRVSGGWRGKDSLVQMLQKLTVPLRVHGSWDNLNYQLQVDQLLRNQLQEEAKRALNNWIDRGREEGNGVKKRLNRL